MICKAFITYGSVCHEMWGSWSRNIKERRIHRLKPISAVELNLEQTQEDIVLFNETVRRHFHSVRDIISWLQLLPYFSGSSLDLRSLTRCWRDSLELL